MKIGIIGAMEEEVTILRHRLEDKETKRIATCEFYTGTIEGVEVVLAKSGIGKVNAAVSAALMLHLDQPDYLINTGSAGGMNDQLTIGDLVISTEVRHHDVDVTALGFEYGQVPEMPVNFVPDENLLAVAEKCANQLTEVRAFKGLIASGDSFNSEPDRVDKLRSKMHDIYATEMEAASIAQVCYQFSVPFLIVRSISDIAGKDAEISFAQFLEQASQHSAEFVLSMLNELKTR